MTPTVRPELQTCYHCKFETTEPISQCPRCGKGLRTAVQIQRQGRFFVLGGALLLAVMLGVIVFVNRLVLAPVLPAGFPRITGSPELLAAMYAALLLPLAFGFACVWKGGAQRSSGRLGSRLLTLGLGIWVVLLAVAAMVPLLR